MPEKRRKFSPQFKAEVVQMVVETGKSIAEVARDLGMHDDTLGNWVNAPHLVPAGASRSPVRESQARRTPQPGRVIN
jgi:transposase-like protein